MIKLESFFLPDETRVIWNTLKFFNFQLVQTSSTGTVVKHVQFKFPNSNFWPTDLPLIFHQTPKVSSWFCLRGFASIGCHKNDLLADNAQEWFCHTIFHCENQISRIISAMNSLRRKKAKQAVAVNHFSRNVVVKPFPVIAFEIAQIWNTFSAACLCRRMSRLSWS